MEQNRIFTVSDLTASVRGLLETHFPFIRVSGEISNLRRPPSGHIYFTLKDHRAQLRAVLFNMQQRYLDEMPREGQQVICHGRLSVYEPRGEYQLIVDHIDFHGTGVLQLAFEKLKKELAAEGLFDSARKKSLPRLPGRIVLVTSPTGAAVRDFIRVAKRRFPGARLSVYPVAVQGDKAVPEICQALGDINNMQPETDIIVLCRGGGSIEDLWAFNEEQTARAIHASKIPVVSAVGHEIDFTIADLVADLRAPTPSAAAEMILPDRDALAAQISRTGARLSSAIHGKLERYENKLALQREKLGTMRSPLETMLLKLDHNAERLERAIAALIQQKQLRLNELLAALKQKDPAGELKLRGQRVAALHKRLLLAGDHVLKNKESKLAEAAGLLHAVSPLATLARGYSITKEPEGAVITDSGQTAAGREVEVILRRGSLLCEVKETREDGGR